jgi:hypothetical protein
MNMKEWKSWLIERPSVNDVSNVYRLVVKLWEIYLLSVGETNTVVKPATQA